MIINAILGVRKLMIMMRLGLLVRCGAYISVIVVIVDISVGCMLVMVMPIIDNESRSGRLLLGSIKRMAIAGRRLGGDSGGGRSCRGST